MPCPSASSVALFPVPPRDTLFVQCPGPLPAGSGRAKGSPTAKGSGPATPLRGAVSPAVPKGLCAWCPLGCLPCLGVPAVGCPPRYVQSLLDIMEFHDKDPEDQATLGQ